MEYIYTSKKEEAPVETKTEHDVKIEINQLVKTATAAKLPIFIMYYSAESNEYKYNAVFPEELGIELESEFNKFTKLLRAVSDFNADSYIPKITR